MLACGLKRTLRKCLPFSSSFSLLAMMTGKLIVAFPKMRIQDEGCSLEFKPSEVHQLEGSTVFSFTEFELFPNYPGIYCFIHLNLGGGWSLFKIASRIQACPPPDLISWIQLQVKLDSSSRARNESASSKHREVTVPERSEGVGEANRHEINARTKDRPMVACSNPRKLSPWKSGNRQGLKFLWTMVIVAFRKLVSQKEQHWAQDLDYESEFEQQEVGRLWLLQYYLEEFPELEVEAVLAVTNFESMSVKFAIWDCSFFLDLNCLNFWHEDSELEENQEVEFDLRPSEWLDSFDKNDLPHKLHSFCSTLITGVSWALVILYENLMAEPWSLGFININETAWVEELVLILATTALFLD
ncbi:hypothetical protein Tco_0434574 [Tanacetum coccineum]